MVDGRGSADRRDERMSVKCLRVQVVRIDAVPSLLSLALKFVSHFVLVVLNRGYVQEKSDSVIHQP